MARLSRFSVGYGGRAPHVKQNGLSAPVKLIRVRCWWWVASYLAPCQTKPGGPATMSFRFAHLQKVRSPEVLPTRPGPLAIFQPVLERTAFHAILLHIGCGRTCPL